MDWKEEEEEEGKKKDWSFMTESLRSTVLLLEKEMATHSSTLAWKSPWKEEAGRLQSMELQRVGHNKVTSMVHWFTGSTR